MYGKNDYDIAIIGGGVVGGLIAYHLAKYQNRIVILEKENDAAMGQSKANSGIVHAGYDPEPGSLKAILNVKGSEEMESLCRDLAVKYRRNGTFVVGYSEQDRENLQELMERGKRNGVKALSLISGEEVRKAEKNLSKKITCALSAPTGAVVCPYELTLHAVGHAMDYGAQFLTNFEVCAITENGYAYQLLAKDGRSVRAKVVLNCAGLYADAIAALAGDDSFVITPRRGEYQLLDKEAGTLVDHTIFHTPTDMGKGVLAVKTVDGNILLGPTSEDQTDKEDTCVTAAGLAAVARKEKEFFETVPMQKVITQFAGLRAHGSRGDFIINTPRENFLNFAGIESPGLSSAPAIGLLAEAMLFGDACREGAALAKKAGISVPVIAEDLLSRERKPDWKPQRKNGIPFRSLSVEEKNRVIAEDPTYGRIVCRCEEITEGEILAAIHQNPPARDVDGVKRRTRAGMGRCQGGFCLPSVCEILAREWGMKETDVTKKGGKSCILTDRTKGTGKEPETMPERKPEYADVAVIGGGPAGMAAALSAREQGAEKVVILEREARLGGILEQCIHNGFGLHRFHEELTGPEYAERYEKMVKAQNITCLCSTTVVNLTEDRCITAVNRTDGYFQIQAKAVVLAMGCREKPRGALSTPGTRPAGVITAGTAQKFVNVKGFLPGKRIVILGSGDIGLIMARRMTLEGAKVEAVCEIMPDSGGLTRNIVQCLQDFEIPLLLHHTVTEIHGKDRVEGVTVSAVDEQLRPIPGTQQYLPCDTLMLSVGLIPENELSKKAGIQMDDKTRGPVVDKQRQTSVSGIFACGNVVKVHELVDFVSAEGETAGRAAARFACGAVFPDDRSLQTEKQTEIDGAAAKKFSQVQKKGVKPLECGKEEGRIVICTVCPMGCRITVDAQGLTRGNTCKRGEAYARQEISEPRRVLTTTMLTEDGRLLPVRSDRAIPREKLADCVKAINNQTLLLPIYQGKIIIENIGGTGANLVAARTMT